MNREKTHASLLGIAGGYLLYIAYELLQGEKEGESAMSPALRILFLVLFAVSGAALVVYAIRQWYKANKNEEKKEDDSGKNGNSLK